MSFSCPPGTPMAVATGHMMPAPIRMLQLSIPVNGRPPDMTTQLVVSVRKHRHDDEERGKLFVGGLSWDTTQESLLIYFSRFGEVIDCVVMKNAESGRSRGFGFVTYSDPSSICRVLARCPHTLDGRTIDPKACNPRSMQKPKKSTYLPKVFLGGLPSSITETDLRNFFSQYGEVCEVVIMYDQEKKKSRGFGFLSFADEQACYRAVAEHFVTIHNKQVEIKRAEPRANQMHAGDVKLDNIDVQEWAIVQGHACQPLTNGHTPAPMAPTGGPVAPPPSQAFTGWAATPQAGPPPPVTYAISPAASMAQTSQWGQPLPPAVEAPWGATVAVAAPHAPQPIPTYASPPRPSLTTQYPTVAYTPVTAGAMTTQPLSRGPMWASSAGLTPPPPNAIQTSSALPPGHIADPVPVSSPHHVAKLAVAYPTSPYPTATAVAYSPFQNPPPSVANKLQPLTHGTAIVAGPAYAANHIDFFAPQPHPVNASGPLGPATAYSTQTDIVSTLGPQRAAIYTQQSQVQSYHPYRRT